MKIYRVQDKYGRGPFQIEISHLWKSPEFIRPPTFMEEFGTDFLHKIDFEMPHFGCGVDSPGALRQWFHIDEVPRLRGLGFDVVVLAECKRIKKSKNQIVFKRRRVLSDVDLFLTWNHVWKS